MRFLIIYIFAVLFNFIFLKSKYVFSLNFLLQSKIPSFIRELYSFRYTRVRNIPFILQIQGAAIKKPDSCLYFTCCKHVLYRNTILVRR
jgi:hypothetical protein